MTLKRVVRGAGGGKGGGGETRSAVEDADSLRSKQFARVVDLLCEGEIEGLVNGNQSIFFNDTPLANGDGSFNFTGVTVATRNGTQAQTYIPGFPSAESEVPVGVQVTLAASVTRTISNVNANKVRVTVGVPQLTRQDTTLGDLHGWQVSIAIDIQSNGGGFVAQVLPDAGLIAGKTTTRYQRAYELNLTGSPPWDVRVRRISPDSFPAAVSNTWWDSYTEVIEAKLSYPNSALVGIEIDASQFNAVPSRGYDIKGLKVQIPANYDPLTRVYSGVWDGTFTVAWTDNPAWCFYDLLTNTRYGLGNFISAAQVDKWSLYSIAQYCDGMVPNGFGSTEPRFTCNLYLQTRAEAFRVVASMASIFRGMVYWGAGTVVPVADMPSDPVALFTNANVNDGKFTYQGSAKNTRHTVALVTWNDPADGYRQKIEYVEDLAGIARYGVVSTDVLAFGCTSRGQAHRMGKWLLYSERLETETEIHRTGLDGVLVYPGAVVSTQDAARAGIRFGGRVVSATTGAVTIDSPVTLDAAKTYALSVVAPDGTLLTGSLTGYGSGATSVLNVSPDLVAAPQVDAIWVLAANDLVPETWRVLAVSEVEKGQLEVVALKHDASKYAAVELNLLFEPTPTSTIPVIPDAPTGLVVTETLLTLGPGGNRATLSWIGTTGRYAVTYRGATSNVVSLDTVNQTIDIDGLTPEVYTFTVRQVNALGTVGPAATLVQEIYGKTAPPADVSGFTVIATGGVALASWTLHPDFDVRVDGTIAIRHSPLTTGAAWNDTILLEEFDGNSISGIVPLVTGTYFAKAIDSTGHYSTNAVSFLATEGMVTGFTTVGTQTEDPTFTGTKVNVVVSGSVLQLSGGTLFDSATGNFDDATGMFDAYGGQATTGTYSFGPLDLTTVAVRRFEADIKSSAFDNAQFFDEHQGNFDDADGLFDGTASAINDADLTLYAATTNDNPAGSPTWSAWSPFLVADFNARAAKFRLDFSVGTPSHNIAVSELRVHAKVPV